MGTGLFARPLDTSQLRNKLGVCARDTHTQAVGGPLWSIYTSSAKAEGKAVRVGQLLLFLSLRSLGLAASARQQAEGVASLPGVFRSARHFAAFQPLLGVDCAV